MRGGKEQLLDKILILAGKRRNAAPAAPLHLIRIGRLALDITRVCERKDAGFLGDQILDIHLAGDMGNLGAAVVAVFFAHGVQLVFHHGQHPGVVCQNIAQVFYIRLQLAQLFFNF